MADNEVTSDILLSTLTKEFVADSFEIVYSMRNGLMQLLGAPTLGEGVSNGHEYQWLNFSQGPTGSTINGTFDDTVTTITVANGGVFRKGMQIQVEGSGEIIAVTAVSGNDLTVVRGYGSTTAEAITTGATVLINSSAREENSLAENDMIVEPAKVMNYYQTMDFALEFSRRAQATSTHGNTNSIAFQLRQKMMQAVTQMNRALIAGRMGTMTVGGKAITTTGGINYFSDQAGALKTDASAQALTLDMINSLNAEIVKRGGMTDTVVVGVDKARELNALVSANYQSQRLQDWSNDAGALNRLPSDLPLVGNVTNIVIDTNVPNNELLLLDSSMLGVRYMPSGNAESDGAWRTIDAAQKGQDGERVRLIGDFVMEIRQHDTNMARLVNLG